MDYFAHCHKVYCFIVLLGAFWHLPYKTNSFTCFINGRIVCSFCTGSGAEAIHIDMCGKIINNNPACHKENMQTQHTKIIC